jgi:hypothetical protein
MLAVLLVAPLLLVACAQAPATTRTVVPVQTLEPGVGADGVQYSGEIQGTIEVWMDEYGIMTWMPHVESPGAYRFQVTNIGWLTHDFTLIHAEDLPGGVPTRSGRALLQGLPIVARSIPIESGATIAIDADLRRPGIYLALSAQGTDYGDGMVTRIRVGSDAGAALGGPGRQQPDPQPTPDLLDRRNIAVYVMDNAVMASRYEVGAGEVTLHVQNLGPSAHELALVQWRGDRNALPVDARGEVLLDTLTVLERLPLLPMSGEAQLMVEVEEDFAYVLLSTSPGAYAAGVSLQLVAR